MIFIKTGFLAAALLMAGAFSLRAQSLSPEVISSAGDVLTSSGGSVSYTIGEPVSETFSATPNILTQGFQQPWTVSLAGIPEQDELNGIYAYPNPVKDDLLIDFTAVKNGSYILKITDVAGKELENKKLETGAGAFIQRVSLSAYENGIYFIGIISADKAYVKTFKIVKQN